MTDAMDHYIVLTTVLQPFVWDHPGEPVPEETFTNSHLSWLSIILYQLPPSIASSLFNLRAWQFFCTTSLQILFSLPVGQAPSSSYSMHFFTQSLSSFHNICPYHHNLFCCSIEIMSSSPSNGMHQNQQMCQGAGACFVHYLYFFSI